MPFKIKSVVVLACFALLSNVLLAQNLDSAEIVSVSVKLDTLNYPLFKGQVIITYKPASDAAIEYFNLYIKRDGNNQKINELPALGKSFTYTEAKADEQSEGFTMSSEPQLESLIVEPHYTVFLNNISYDTCENALQLNWNNYIGWHNGIKAYQVYSKTANEPYQLKSTITNNTTYTEPNVLYNTRYRYYIKAISNSDIESFSNIAEIFTPDEPIVNTDALFIDTIVKNGAQIDLALHTDNPENFKGLNLLTKTDENQAFEFFEFILSLQNNRYNSTHVVENNQQGAYYIAEMVNSCNQTLATSNIVQTNVLKGENNTNIVTLNWNASFPESSEKYTIQVDIDGAGFTTIQNNLISNSAEFNLLNLSNNGQSEQFCFRCLSNSVDNYYSQSNSICFLLQPNVLIPTAFTPNGDGINDYFNPIIQNAQISSYQFIIYDRYGDMLFETNNKAEKWDGKAKGKNIIEGVYLYYLKFSTQGGSEFEKSGTVNAIYP